MPTTERPGWPEHGEAGAHWIGYYDGNGNPRCGGCGRKIPVPDFITESAAATERGIAALDAGDYVTLEELEATMMLEQVNERFPAGHPRCDEFCMCAATRAVLLRRVAEEVQKLIDQDLEEQWPAGIPYEEESVISVKVLETWAAELRAAAEVQ